MSLVNGSLLKELFNGPLLPIGGFTVLDSDSNLFNVLLTVLDSDGNPFIISQTVLDSDGNQFNPI